MDRTVTENLRDLFIQLSPPERKCLAPEVTSENDLLAAVEFDGVGWIKGFRCLSEENRFQLYMSVQEWGDELDEATHRCIWNSVAEALELGDPQKYPGHETATLRLIAILLTMPAYCTVIHQPDLVPPNHELYGEEGISYMLCSINSIGGREAWVKLLKEDGWGNSQVEAQIEDACGK